MHISARTILKKLEDGPKTKNQMRTSSCRMPYLAELVMQGYATKAPQKLANNATFPVYTITDAGRKLLANLDAPKPQATEPRTFVSTQPLVMQDKTVYRPGSLDAFSKPSRYAGGVVDYKTSLK